MRIVPTVAGGALVAGLAFALPSIAAPPPVPPPIRTSAANTVPACVTPERLMAFLATRNARLDPRFRDIAKHYKAHGDTWRVRWDYAFYQMAIETNFLSYRRPDGRMGDVDPLQNNFAGIGTTGGGVPGDRYRDVSTGVLAQIQHLVVYSGERLAQPIAPRTQLKQDVILQLSEPIAQRRPLTFADLAGRWAVDKAYGRSIEWVADSFRQVHCRGVPPEQAARAAGKFESPRKDAQARPVIVDPPKPAVRASARLAQSSISTAAKPATCAIEFASYGGPAAVVVQSARGTHATFTVLDVAGDAAGRDAQAFVAGYAAGGQIVGHYLSRAAAIASALDHCPQGLGRADLRGPTATTRAAAR